MAGWSVQRRGNSEYRAAPIPTSTEYNTASPVRSPRVIWYRLMHTTIMQDLFCCPPPVWIGRGLSCHKVGRLALIYFLLTLCLANGMSFPGHARGLHHLRTDAISREETALMSEHAAADHEFAVAHRRAAATTLVSPDRCHVLYSLARQALGLQGDFWECGVYKGGTAAMLAEIIARRPADSGTPPSPF